MFRKTLLTIEREWEVLDRIKQSRTSLRNKIQAGLWCPPISLGARAIGFIKYETDELLSAYINNFSPDEIRALVQKLIAERRSLLEKNHG